MSLNIFGKTYLAPDYLYDNGYNRIIFSKEKNQAVYLNYESFEFPGLDSNVITSTVSVLNLIEDGSYESIAHYIKHLHEENVEARIYADEDSWFLIFFTWLKIAFPNLVEDTAFTLYNLIKQREDLVFPDDREFRTFMASRLYAKNRQTILNKQEFLAKFAEFNSTDTTSSAYYTEVREAIKEDLCVEIQLASYLSGATDISILKNKIIRIGTKNIFDVLDDLRDYIRENILTESVRELTGVLLSWDDQNWEETLKTQSDDMNFLFNHDTDALQENYEYRLANVHSGLSWLQWLIDNTNEEDKNNIELGSIISASERMIYYTDCLSSNTEISEAKCAELITEDLNFKGTTMLFQREYSRDRVNTFWIEYVYQMAKANDVAGLRKISHT